MGPLDSVRVTVNGDYTWPETRWWTVHLTTSDLAAFEAVVARIKALALERRKYIDRSRGWLVDDEGLHILARGWPAMGAAWHDARLYGEGRAGSDPARERDSGRQSQSQRRQSASSPAIPTEVEEAFATMHLLPTAPAEVMQVVYRVLARTVHPDAGGSTAAMTKLNQAYESAREWHGRAPTPLRKGA
jgi:hypothetical protein